MKFIKKWKKVRTFYIDKGERYNKTKMQEIERLKGGTNE